MVPKEREYLHHKRVMSWYHLTTLRVIFSILRDISSNGQTTFNKLFAYEKKSYETIFDEKMMGPFEVCDRYSNLPIEG